MRVRDADGTPNVIPVFDMIFSGATVTRTGPTTVQILMDSGAGGTGAPTDAPYVVYSANATLSAERILTAGSSITLVTDATLIYVNALTGGGGAVYAPTGGVYLTYAPDAELTAERILIAGTGVTVASDGTNFFTSVNTNVRDKAFVFFLAGNLSTTMVGEGARIYIPFNLQPLRVQLAAATSAFGQTVIVDVNQYNNQLAAGTSMFTAQADQPQIPSAFATGSATTFTAIGTLYSGSYLGVDLDQAGSTVAGSNLTVTIISRSS